MRRIKSDAERFWQKVQRRHEGCWVWTGALQRDGYAHFTNADQKTISAHRFSYELHVGQIPAGMDLLHSCDQRSCTNPLHLRPGTHRENMMEMIHKGRNPHHHLKPDQVREIRVALAEPYLGLQTDLAKKYNVDRCVINRINVGRTYRWVA